MGFNLVIRSSRVITESGERPAAIGVMDGKISAIFEFEEVVEAIQDITIPGVLMPGLVDSHVHINEPGRTQWEGFESATRSAAAGGVTTLIDMPLNCIPPTTSVDALRLKEDAAFGKCSVDVGFWGGSIPGSAPHLIPLHNAGVFGFKCFLLHSGVEEFPESTPQDFASALEILAKFDGLMVVHAEDSVVIQESKRASSQKYTDFLASRPKEAEDAAIAQVISQARQTGARVHVLHLSSGAALDSIKAAKSGGVRITVETCPHYLSLTAEEIQSGATQYKCCPPIREKSNQDELWRGLFSGVIDAIVSDHSPCTADLKLLETGDFQEAWGGIASLQLGLPIVWTVGANRGADLFQISQWMSRRPAEIAGLRNKGAIAVGKDADLIEFNPEAEFVVDPAKLFHRNAVTPYGGKVLKGVVSQTWLRGEPIYQNGSMTGTPRGHFLYREGSSR